MHRHIPASSGAQWSGSGAPRLRAESTAFQPLIWAAMETSDFTLDMAREFHRCMATIIDSVQEGIWRAGRIELLGYDTDFGLGQKRGLQTLVLKTRGRSTYLRLEWNTVIGGTPADRELIAAAVRDAIDVLV
jgi:hypothetical protein